MRADSGRRRAAAAWRARLRTTARAATHLCAIVCALAFAGLTAPAVTAAAAPTARLQATLTPRRLDHGTTIGFALQVSGAGGQPPPALTAIDVRYPGNLGIALSGLGLATCQASTLQQLGPYGCPRDAVMGYGEAVAQLTIGPEIINESVPIVIFRAPDQEGRLALLFSVIGTRPVLAALVFPGLVEPASAPFGGTVAIQVPLVPGLYESPDVALVSLHASLGPMGVTYYERVHGRTVGYRPRGILLPGTCPRGGFPFAAELSFQDGSRASAKATVACPRHVPAKRKSTPRGT